MKFRSIHLVSIIILTTMLSIHSCQEKVVSDIKLNYCGLLVDNESNKLIDSNVYETGSYLISPNEQFIVFNTNQKLLNLKQISLTRDDKKVAFNLRFRYKINKEELVHLYNDFGIDFQKHVVIPEILDACRNTLKKYDSVTAIKKENYRTYEKKIFSRVDSVFREKYLIICSLDIVEIKLDI